MEFITNTDYNHTKRISKDFDIKHLGEYHDFYLKRDTLLLADVFGNFKKMCLDIHKLDSAKFPSVPELVWQVALKNAKGKMKLLILIFY